MGKILKKITLKEMGLDKGTIFDACRDAATVIGWKEVKDASGAVVKVPSQWANKGPAIKLAQFVGNVSMVKPGTNKETGQSYAKLIGQFEAINLLSGEAFSETSTLILPDFIGNGIASAIIAGAQSVDFAVIVTANYDDTSAVGYVFGAESLMPTAQADSVSAIKAKLANAGVALAAPKDLPKLENGATSAAAPAAAPADKAAEPAAATPAPTPAPAPAAAKGKQTARA